MTDSTPQDPSSRDPEETLDARDVGETLAEASPADSDGEAAAGSDAEETLLAGAPDAEETLFEGAPAPRVGSQQTVGPYRIVGKLGEGGMGVVYEAEQATPKRRVALKLGHGGPFVDELRFKMFEREIETLGRLVHPNIAAIHDAGVTEEGQQFFAMELVRGETLGDYCDRVGAPSSRPELEKRLALFRTICDAVHYAHQRGVVHRDLKPANLIVSREERGAESSQPGLPVVKVLDFGLARITDSDMAAATVITEVGVVRGTLPYMSPEQTKGDPGAIDVRTDVYALGIILYEMLTLRRPYDVGESLMGAVRVINEQRPDRLADGPAGERLLSGDLQTIVAKALEKDPEQRYQSAAALSGDIERFLARQPILARPPSTMYQLRKAVERNRTVSALVAALALSVVASLFWMSLLFARAEREARISSAVNQFLNEDLLAAADPTRTPNREITVREVLDAAAEKIDTRFEDRPLVQAAVRSTLGETYSNLGLFEQAEPQLERTLELQRETLGGENADTLRTQSRLGHLHYEMGEIEEAEAELLATIEEQTRALGAEHPDTLWTRVALGKGHVQLGRLEEAEAIGREVFEIYQRNYGPTDERTLEVMDVLAVALLDQGRAPEAEELFDVQLPLLREHYGPEDPRVLTRQTSLGWLYFEQGRLEEARDLTEPTLETLRRVLGNQHPDTLTSVNNLGIIYRRMGRADDAAPLYLEAYEVARDTLGEEHPETLISMSNVGRLYQSMGRCAEAVPLLERSVELHRQEFPDLYLGTAYTLATLGECQAELGRRAAARQTLRDAVHILDNTPGASPDRTEQVKTVLKDLGAS